jgi:hypothetical protein
MLLAAVLITLVVIRVPRAPVAVDRNCTDSLGYEMDC